jgi:hypothetical protein
MLTPGMKPWDKVSSFWDANTPFQGQQNKGRSDKDRTQRIKREDKRQRREITEEQITEERSKK